MKKNHYIIKNYEILYENREFDQELKAGNFGSILNEYNYNSGIVYFNSKIVLYNLKQKNFLLFNLFKKKNYDKIRKFKISNLNRNK
jgi:hypothetical protein